MRFRFYIVIIVLFLLSCSKDKVHEVFEQEDVEEWISINTDSIFEDLDRFTLDRKAAQVDNVMKKVKSSTTFNGTVLFAEKGRLVFEKSYGVRNLRTRKGQLCVDDIYQLSSVSKMFTAEAIMILHDRGLIDYDTVIQAYIPEFPYEGITPRMLLNHRSGLPRYELLADEKWQDRTKPFSNEDMIGCYVKYKPAMLSRPDKKFNYSNVNYALLASIVERVSGESFAGFMQKEIFDKLGMHRSFIYDMPLDEKVPAFLPDSCVQGYYVGRRRPRQAQNEYLNGVKGDKIMFSDVEDMYRFWIGVEYGLLMPDSIQAEAFKPGSPTKKKNEDNYGFGWRISQKHKECIYHYGWWKGYRSFYIRDNKNDRVLIVLTNTDKGPNSDKFWKLIEDNSISLAPASVNIHYLEYKEGLRFPYSSYLDRN